MTGSFKGIYRANHLSYQDQQKNILNGKEFDIAELPFLERHTDGTYRVTKGIDDLYITVVKGVVKLKTTNLRRSIGEDNSFIITTKIGNVHIFTKKDSIYLKFERDYLPVIADALEVKIDDLISRDAIIEIPAKFFDLDIEGIFEITL